MLPVSHDFHGPHRPFGQIGEQGYAVVVGQRFAVDRGDHVPNPHAGAIGEALPVYPSHPQHPVAHRQLYDATERTAERHAVRRRG